MNPEENKSTRNEWTDGGEREVERRGRKKKKKRDRWGKVAEKRERERWTAHARAQRARSVLRSVLLLGRSAMSANRVSRSRSGLNDSAAEPSVSVYVHARTKPTDAHALLLPVGATCCCALLSFNYARRTLFSRARFFHPLPLPLCLGSSSSDVRSSFLFPPDQPSSPFSSSTYSP